MSRSGLARGGTGGRVEVDDPLAGGEFEGPGQMAAAGCHRDAASSGGEVSDRRGEDMVAGCDYDAREPGRW
jgi:hypothetical protein